MNHQLGKLTLDRLELDNGGSLEDVTQVFESWGSLNNKRDNAILILHALTGNSHAASGSANQRPGWWEFLIGPGKAVDTLRYYVICVNVLGGCDGSTGPSSVNPQTGCQYRLTFPTITIRDMVRCQKNLLDHLGISSLMGVIGGSMGGMQALEWGAMYPKAVGNVIAVGCPGRAYPHSIAFRTIQRKAIMSDPSWKNGEYQEDYPEDGIALARMIGFISYRSEGEFTERFGRDHAGEDLYSLTARFEVEEYLNHQGRKLVNRFDPNTYLYLSKAMDLHDLGHQRESYEAGIRRIEAKVTLVGLSSDQLFPTHQQQEVSGILSTGGRSSQYQEVDTIHGHDGFLIEQDQISAIVASALRSTRKEITLCDSKPN